MTAVIGLTGYARAGKDTVGEILCSDYGFTRLAFADVLKDTALGADPYVRTRIGSHQRLSSLIEHIGWERAKENDDVRRFLQNLGLSVRDNIGSDTWLTPVISAVRSGSAPGYVITDVRFPNEAQAVRDAGGFLVRVTRPGTAPALGHISDTALSDTEPDATLHNGSTREDLDEAVFQLLQVLYPPPERRYRVFSHYESSPDGEIRVGVPIDHDKVREYVADRAAALPPLGSWHA